ncbi:Sorting nexin-2 [Cricetulus griseus]|uniref:Sorting nexin-2 n=1 Tax=Cricetulus griseus TaxID=10029 RepID=G3HKA5_CRIGR|nr:Sorting nexin-2 [Cricetulus griseus]
MRYSEKQRSIPIHCLLFFSQSSPSSPEPASLPAEDISANSNGSKPVEVMLDDDREDLFAEATEEVSLDSPEREPILSSEPSPAVTPVTPTALIAPRIESKSISAPVIFDRSREEIEEEANGDIFDIEIGVSDPEKVGDGMNAYMAYRVTTKLPRAVNTQALSGAGILRMVNKAADAVNKMTIKMNESDAWFEEKQQQFENLDQQLRKLHASVEALVCHRKELSANTAAFAKSAAMLGNSEDHTALSRALSQLAEVEEKIDQLHQEQAFADFYMFSELLSDYIRLIAAVKGVFDHRMKCWQKWEDAQITLLKKRETEAKMMVANKPDKIQQAKNEIREKERVKDFKSVIIKYLESLVQTQQQMTDTQCLMMMKSEVMTGTINFPPIR